MTEHSKENGKRAINHVLLIGNTHLDKATIGVSCSEVIKYTDKYLAETQICPENGSDWPQIG